jgi:hypothetical protein
LEYARLSDTQVGAWCCRTESDTGRQGLCTLGWWFTVNLRKLVGFLVVIFVLFWIIAQPASASGSVNNVMANLRSAGSSIATFMTNIF